MSKSSTTDRPDEAWSAVLASVQALCDRYGLTHEASGLVMLSLTIYLGRIIEEEISHQEDGVSDD